MQRTAINCGIEDDLKRSPLFSGAGGTLSETKKEEEKIKERKKKKGVKRGKKSFFHRMLGLISFQTF